MFQILTEGQDASQIIFSVNSKSDNINSKFNNTMLPKVKYDQYKNNNSIIDLMLWYLLTWNLTEKLLKKQKLLWTRQWLIHTKLSAPLCVNFSWTQVRHYALLSLVSPPSHQSPAELVLPGSVYNWFSIDQQLFMNITPGEYCGRDGRRYVASVTKCHNTKLVISLLKYF